MALGYTQNGIAYVRQSRDTEYVVNEMDAEGEITDTRAYPTLKEARQDFATAPAPAEIEQYKNIWRELADGSTTLWDRSFKVIESK